MVLLDNQEVKRDWQSLKDEVCSLFTKHGSQIKSAKVWEERRLAYPIKHHLRATYFLVYHDGDTDVQTAIGRDLTYAEPVLRHLSVVCEEIPADAMDGADDFDPDQVRFESSFQEPDAPVVEEEPAAEAADAESAEGGESEASEGEAAKTEGEAEKTEGEPAGDAEASTQEETTEEETKDKGDA